PPARAVGARPGAGSIAVLPARRARFVSARWLALNFPAPHLHARERRYGLFGFEQYGSSPQPSMEDLRRRLSRWTSKRVVIPIIAVLLILWLASGIYVVGPGEVGVVVQFGRHVAIAQPGLKYTLPRPIQTHYIVHGLRVRWAETGCR